MKLKAIFFIFLCLISPWFWLLILNPSEPLLNLGPEFNLNTHFYISQINTYRGWATQNGFGLLGKLVINKYTWSVKEGAARVIESFDPHYLLIEGDINADRSTGKNGLVYLWLIPFVAYYFFKQNLKTRLILVGSLLASCLPSIFFEEHFYSPAKILLFLILNWLAVSGFILLKNKKIKYALMTIWLFEVTKFFHQYYFHYLKS